MSLILKNKRSSRSKNVTDKNKRKSTTVVFCKNQFPLKKTEADTIFEQVAVLAQRLENDGKQICVMNDINSHEVTKYYTASQFYCYSYYFNRSEFSDVTLCVTNREIPAHKLILASRSAEFKRFFQLFDYIDKVQITSIDYETMLDVIRYIYTGVLIERNLGHTDEIFTRLQKILKADSLLFAENLRENCERKLIRRLTKNNVMDCLVLAESVNSVNLKEAAIKYCDESIRKPDLLSMFKSYPGFSKSVFNQSG